MSALLISGIALAAIYWLWAFWWCIRYDYWVFYKVKGNTEKFVSNTLMDFCFGPFVLPFTYHHWNTDYRVARGLPPKNSKKLLAASALLAGDYQNHKNDSREAEIKQLRERTAQLEKELEIS